MAHGMVTGTAHGIAFSPCSRPLSFCRHAVNRFSVTNCKRLTQWRIEIAPTEDCVTVWMSAIVVIHWNFLDSKKSITADV